MEAFLCHCHRGSSQLLAQDVWVFMLPCMLLAHVDQSTLLSPVHCSHPGLSAALAPFLSPPLPLLWNSWSCLSVGQSCPVCQVTLTIAPQHSCWGEHCLGRSPLRYKEVYLPLQRLQNQASLQHLGLLCVLIHCILPTQLLGL